MQQGHLSNLFSLAQGVQYPGTPPDPIKYATVHDKLYNKAQIVADSLKTFHASVLRSISSKQVFVIILEDIFENFLEIISEKQFFSVKMYTDTHCNI